jgi:hypothetical protein
MTPVRGVALIAGSMLVAASLIPLPVAAAAQRTDPPANSPAGVIYQIPFDQGRSDAAPVASAPAASATATARATPSAATSTAGGKAPPGVSPSDPSSIHSENGFGSSTAVPGVAAGAVLYGAGTETRAGAGSAVPTYLLLGIVLVAAVAIGFGVARAARSRREGP